MQEDADNAMSNKDCNIQSQPVDEGQSKISRLDFALDVSCFKSVLGWQAPAALSNSIGQALSSLQSGQQSPSVDVGWQQWVAPLPWAQAWYYQSCPSISCTICQAQKAQLPESCMLLKADLMSRHQPLLHHQSTHQATVHLGW